MLRSVSILIASSGWPGGVGGGVCCVAGNWQTSGLWSSVSPGVDLGGIVNRRNVHRFQSAWCPYPSARGSRVRTKPDCFVWPAERNYAAQQQHTCSCIKGKVRYIHNNCTQSMEA